MTVEPTVPPARSASRTSRLVLGLLSGFAISVATAIILEGGASLVLFGADYAATNAAPQVVRAHTTTDTLLGWVNRPNFTSPGEFGPGIGLTTTPDGFRTTAAPVAGTGVDPRRLVCSGDSFTMGYGVADEKSWCSLLGGRFRGLATANMGQGAYGLDQAYLWYQREGARLTHQIQILAITGVMLERSTTGNYMGRFKPVFELENGRLVLRNVPVPEQTQAALHRAYSVRLLEDLRLLQVIRKVFNVDGTRGTSRRVDDQWALFEKILEQLAAYHQARNSQLLLVYLPTKRDLHSGPHDARRQRLADFAERHGVAMLDLTPPLRSLRADSVDLAFITRIEPGAAPGIPGHYSNLGNVWAADLIARKLARMPILAGRAIIR